MPHFSHNSFVSSADKNGFCHTYSIDPSAFSRNEHSSTYECKARSNGGLYDPSDGAILLAKFSENTKDDSSETWAEREVEKTKLAQEMAHKFNHQMRHQRRITANGSCSDYTENQEIEFLIPQTSQLDSVSFLDRSRKKQESFIVVNKFEHFQTFLCMEFDDCLSKSKKTKKPKLSKKSRSVSFSSTESLCNSNSKKEKRVYGRKKSNSESDVGNTLPHSHRSTYDQILTFCHRCEQWNKPTRQFVSGLRHSSLHAFVHYFFCQSGGKMAIDCLEGGYDEREGYSLTVPIIHSADKRFGIHDRGVEGISKLVQEHVCTDLCKHLPEMSSYPQNRTPHQSHSQREECLTPCCASSPLSPQPTEVQFQLPPHYDVHQFPPPYAAATATTPPFASTPPFAATPPFVAPPPYTATPPAYDHHAHQMHQTGYNNTKEFQGQCAGHSRLDNNISYNNNLSHSSPQASPIAHFAALHCG